MGNRTIVASAPHIHSDLSTTRLMGDVIIALLPAVAVSVYVYGWGVLGITGVSIGCCVLFETLIQKLFAAKHFQGHWWSYICEEHPEENFEHWISRYVIPVTIDQRYGKEELEYLASVILTK